MDTPMTEDEIKAKLTPEEYKVLREQGTEMPFSGAYVDNHESGMYRCKVCGHELFSSDAKFDSGNGVTAYRLHIRHAGFSPFTPFHHALQRLKAIRRIDAESDRVSALRRAVDGEDARNVQERRLGTLSLGFLR